MAPGQIRPGEPRGDFGTRTIPTCIMFFLEKWLVGIRGAERHQATWLYH